MKQAITSIKDANENQLKEGDFVYAIKKTSTSGSCLIPGIVVGFKKIGSCECAKIIAIETCWRSKPIFVTHYAGHKLIKCNDMNNSYKQTLIMHKKLLRL